MDSSHLSPMHPMPDRHRRRARRPGVVPFGLLLLALISLESPFSAAAQQPQNVELIGELGGFQAWRAVVSGGYAYALGREGGGLRVVDVRDPRRPSEVAALPTGALEIAVAGLHAYLADTSRGLRVFSVADPAAPAEVGVFALFGQEIDNVVVDGTRAYTSSVTMSLPYARTFRVLDVSDPARPTELGSVPVPRWAVAAAASGRYVYLADGFGGLYTVDVADPARPTQVGSLAGTGNEGEQTRGDVALAGRYAYVLRQAGWRVVDVADPSAPALVADTPSLIPFAVEAIGSAVYLGQGASSASPSDGLYVWDASTPSAPRQAGFYPVGEAPAGHGIVRDVALACDLVYVAAGARGLLIERFTGSAGSSPGVPQTAAYRVLVPRVARGCAVT